MAPMLAPLLLAGTFLPAPAPASTVLLWDNGSFMNAPGLSVLQDVSLGMTTFGFAHTTANGTRIADDFEAACRCGARLQTIVFYGYQTGSTPVSTFNNVNVQVWNGPPDAPGSSVVAGSTLINRLIGTAFTNVFRVSESAPGATQRPIMMVQAALETVLAPGLYWLDWQTGGSLPSGPWAVPITINGEATTGNARQRVPATGLWQDALDAGTGTPQGFPFRIYGSCDPCDPAP